MKIRKNLVGQFIYHKLSDNFPQIYRGFSEGRHGPLIGKKTNWGNKT